MRSSPGACCCSAADAGGAAHHTTDPVPYLLVDSADDGPGGTYSEAATAGCTPVRATRCSGGCWRGLTRAAPATRGGRGFTAGAVRASNPWVPRFRWPPFCWGNQHQGG